MRRVSRGGNEGQARLRLQASYSVGACRRGCS
jgi:hypothetical protein